MRALAFLLLLFGPVLAAPAAAGLWIWRSFPGDPDSPAYALAAGAATGLVVFALVRRRSLVRQATMLALTFLWAGWLWMGLTDRRYDWTYVPPMRAPDGAERAILLLIVLAYLTLYVLVEEARPRRVS